MAIAEPKKISTFNRNARVDNPDGSYSTLRSLSFKDPRDGKETLIPSVIKRNQEWEVVNPKQAINHYKKSGEYLGKYDTPEEADKAGFLFHLLDEGKQYVPTFVQRLGYQRGKEQAQKQYSTWGEWANDRFKH